MFVLKRILFLFPLIVLVTSASIKNPTGAPWASYASKSAYARALGPPASVMDTITVPYIPKSPFFPKFVDPKSMISKKTDMLSNLFGGLGPAYPMGFKPFVPYIANGPPIYSSDEAQLANTFSKTNMDESSSAYKRGAFGPFSSKPFAPMNSKFGPMSQFSSFNSIPDYKMKDEFSRRKRNVEESPQVKLRAVIGDGKPDIKDLGPPPPYPTLAPIFEEPEDNLFLKTMGSPTAPKQYLPGMFGPFGPFGPVVDPSMFIAKKSSFLDTLFKNLATTTPSPIFTETPTTKTTIVPPDFWFPSSLIPSPTEYNAKVGQFLDKLFENLQLNKTTATSDEKGAGAKTDFVRSVNTAEDEIHQKVARSIEDLASINTAKDTIVDSIVSELGDLKSNMVKTMNDLVSYEKSTGMSAKKTFKPFAASPWAKPTVDGLFPFQQKMMVLSQVFDMLTDLQKNITLAIQNAIKSKMAMTDTAGEAFNAKYPIGSEFSSTAASVPFNASLLEAIKHKLSTYDYETPLSYNPTYGKFGLNMARMLPKTPASFWVSYPDEVTATKRDVDTTAEPVTNDESDLKQETRSVKMQMHQGYQSLPDGSIESLQAGGGSTPGHQGGGIKLFIQMPVLPNMQVPGLQNNNFEN